MVDITSDKLKRKGTIQVMLFLQRSMAENFMEKKLSAL